MRIEMKALEGTDIKNDLWKDKCKELYEISKSLEQENDGLRLGLKKITTEKVDLEKMNDQMLKANRQNSAIIHGQVNNSEFALETRDSENTRHAAIPKTNIRENMILNRK